MKTGNGIIQTGNGIISPTSWPLAKNHILQNVSNFNYPVQKLALKTGNGIIETGYGIVFPTSWPPIEKRISKMFLAFTNESKTGF